MRLWKIQALSFHYWSSGEFPDCIKKLSRKGFGLGTWDELGKLPSRPDFSYSRKKKNSWTFSIRPFLVFNFCPRVGDEWLWRGWERFLSNSCQLKWLCETALGTSFPEIPKALSVLERMTFITSRECSEEQFHMAFKKRGYRDYAHLTSGDAGSCYLNQQIYKAP